MTGNEVITRFWKADKWGERLACPECEKTGCLEKRTDGMAKCQRCNHSFSTDDVVVVEEYTDPHVTKKTHEAARAYHTMTGDLESQEAN